MTTPKKIFAFLLIISATNACAVLWSKTSIEAATAQIPPILQTKMKAVTIQSDNLSKLYGDTISKSMQDKTQKIIIIKKLENEILVELKKIGFHQTIINRIEAVDE